MNWNQARRILLVWPKDGRPLSHKLDLQLVARYAASLGAQLALVTKDAQVQVNAGLLGIPVFSSPRQAQDNQWNDIQRHKFEPPKGMQLDYILEKRLAF